MGLFRLVTFLLQPVTLLFCKQQPYYALPAGQQYYQKYFTCAYNKKHNYTAPITMKIIGRAGICRFNQQQLWVKTCSYD
jgi:hypothetical protein